MLWMTGGGSHVDGLSKEPHNERGEEKKEKETERERAKENGCGVEGRGVEGVKEYAMCTPAP